MLALVNAVGCQRWWTPCVQSIVLNGLFSSWPRYPVAKMNARNQSWAVHTDMLQSELQVVLGEFGPRLSISGFPSLPFSHSVPLSGLLVSIFKSLYCSKNECHLGCSSSTGTSFPPFLCPTVSPFSTAGLKQEGGVGSHYCRSHFLFFS